LESNTKIKSQFIQTVWQGMLVLVSIFIHAFSIAQVSSDSLAHTDKKEKEPFQILFKPKISMGIGTFTFYGDVGSNNKNYHPNVSRIAYDLKVINPLTEYLDMNFYVLFGQVSANERSLTRNYNFQSNITTGGMTLTYHFNHIMPSNFKVNPYFSTGIESVEFLSKTDLRDGQGRYYHYWSNGAIMDRPEDAPDAGQAVELIRDYVYETDLRELNLDGLGKYPERTWAIPVEFGGNWNLGERVNFRLSMTMHFTQSDLIDNLSGDGVGIREGNKRNDRFLYTSAALTYDLKQLSWGKSGRVPKDFNDDEWYDLMAADTMDYDGDGIPDKLDMCPKTPLDHRPVDKFGCPYDKDKDGVADVIDMEPNTPERAPVNKDGIAYTDDDFFLMYRMYKDSIGEFSQVEDVLSSTTSDGADKFRGGRTTDGLVLPENKKYTVIIGSDEIGVNYEDLHKFLSNKDFKTIDNGTSVTYIIGEYSNLADAVAAQKELEKQGFTPSMVGELTKNDKGKLDVVKVSASQLATAGTSTAAISTIQETVYKVQIGAFKRKLSGNVFKDLPDVVYVKGDDGLYRYYSGSYTDKNKAAEHRVDVLTKGYTGAFIVAFKEGSRISLQQAGYEVTPTYKPKDVTTESNVPTANAIDKNLIKFKVQVGAYQNKIPTNVLDLYLAVGNVVPRRDADSGLTKYFVGTFNSYEEAAKFKQDLLNKGLVDAFVVGEFSGKIITATEALDLIK
jgi:hypothetical protein